MLAVNLGGNEVAEQVARGQLAAPGDHRGEIFIHRSADISKFLHHSFGLVATSPPALIFRMSSLQARPPRSMTLSSRERESSRMRGSRLVLILGVNAFETSTRSFVCFGGSSKINQLAGAGTRLLNDSWSLRARLTPS